MSSRRVDTMEQHRGDLLVDAKRQRQRLLFTRHSVYGEIARGLEEQGVIEIYEVEPRAIDGRRNLRVRLNRSWDG